MGRQKRFLRHHPGLRHAITHYDRLGFALGVVLVAALAVPVAGYLMLASTFIGIDWLWRKMAPVSYRKFFDWPLAYTFGMIGGAFPLFIVIVGGGMLTAAFPLMKLILGVVFFGFWVLVILDLTWQREQREQRGKVLLFKK